MEDDCMLCFSWGQMCQSVDITRNQAVYSVVWTVFQFGQCKQVNPTCRQWFRPHLTLHACECAMFSGNCLVQAVRAVQQTRGDQKVLGLNYVQNKIKIVFASYSSKAQNTTCTIWLWAINILCILAVVSYPQSKWGKVELCSVMKWQLRLIRSLHCMLCCSDSESKWWIHVSWWITSCEINFCWVTSVSFEKFFRNLCTVLVLASGHASDRHFSHTLKCTKYLYPKSHIAHVVF